MMQIAIRILLKRVKEYEAELIARGTTLAAETERLRKAGQLYGKTSSLPRSHQTTSIKSR